MLGYSPRRLKSYPGEDALAFPPLQLGPEDREELRLREAHEADPCGALDHLYGVVLPEAHADLAVHGDHDVLVRHQRDLDPVHAREDDRSVRQRVGTDRRQHDRVHRREQDGPAGREVVGGRASGRRDDEAVGAVGGGVLSFDRHREIDDTTHRGLGDDDVVEGGVLAEPLAVPDDARDQHHTLVHRHPAREDRLERREHLVQRRRGEEAEPAEVHAEQRHAEVADRASRREEGAVAAEHHDQVHLCGQGRLAHGGDGGRRDQPGRLPLEHRGGAPRGASTPNTDGKTFSSEMNETSMTASVGCSPKIRGSRARALLFSITMTRGSLRSLASSWPTPTSTAYTRAAPRWSRQSVKPPVEAPTSRQTRPATFIWKASSAWASFSPPRLTNGERPRSEEHTSELQSQSNLVCRLL